MVGLDTRATMDMDATIKGLSVNEQTVREMFEEICKIELEDDVTFSFRSIGEIREGDEYTGYRVSVSANYPPMAVPLKLDITTGDKITPKEIEYRFKLLLEDRSISVLAYNLETIMAEKLETVISRGDQNTRPRDYYDIYALAKLQYTNIELDALRAALNATTKGSVTFHVEGKMEGDEVALRFRITDTGVGIKPEDMYRLFSAFERIEENHNRTIEGTGLGMNITIKLLKLMDSELLVESEYGKGSVFWFDIRQKVMNTEKVGDFKKWVRTAEREKVYHPAFTAPDARILLVDDNLVNRKVFCGLLKQTKPVIRSIGSGKECLDLITKEQYDLIFLDHMMPEMDGIETFERMLQLENNLCKDTPVVMLTANAISGARESYFKMGFQDFLAKPITQEKLDEILEKWLPDEKRIYPSK